jgi:hypothetical protein
LPLGQTRFSYEKSNRFFGAKGTRG